MNICSKFKLTKTHADDRVKPFIALDITCSTQSDYFSKIIPVYFINRSERQFFSFEKSGVR